MSSRTPRPVPISPRTAGLALVVVLTPVLLWALLTLRPHDGRVSRVEDYLLLIATEGWQSFTLAVCAAIGPVLGSVIGTLLGVDASARPRQVGELTYLAAAGDRRYRRVMAGRMIAALVGTVLWISLLVIASVAVGWLAFRTGEFESIDGDPISSSEVLRIVLHCVLATYCIGLVCCATVATLGARISVQGAAAAGMCLYFLELATGSMPIIGRILRVLPFGNYHGWTNRLAEDLSRGSSTMLYVTSTAWILVGLALVASRGFARLPRVGGTA